MPVSPTPSDCARRTGLRARWLVAGTLILTAVVGFDLATVASAAPSRPAAHSAPANGQIVGGDPTVRAGQLIELSLAGFAPDGPITVGLAGRSTSTPYQADGQGELRATYTVPVLRPGRYLLAISGPGAAITRSPAVPAGANLMGTVPHVARYPFTVSAGGAGSGG
jgi:hypothetical protein